MPSGMPFTNIYPDGAADGSSGTTVSAADATLNAQYPGMPAGATPVHRDQVYTAAGTYDLWTPPPGKRVVLAAAMVSVDAAGRVAIVDGIDVDGSRYVDQEAQAGGGSSPNLIPVPRPAASPGTPVRVVVGAGPTRASVRVSGWLAD